MAWIPLLFMESECHRCHGRGNIDIPPVPQYIPLLEQNSLSTTMPPTMLKTYSGSAPSMGVPVQTCPDCGGKGKK